MSWTKTHDLSVVTGTYQSQGKEKKRYENVGYVLTADDGGKMICLKRTFNPAGLPTDGRDTIVLNMFDQKPKGERDDAPPAAAPPARKAAPPAIELDDEIPF